MRCLKKNEIKKLRFCAEMSTEMSYLFKSESRALDISIASNERWPLNIDQHNNKHSLQFDRKRIPLAFGKFNIKHIEFRRTEFSKFAQKVD